MGLDVIVDVYWGVSYPHSDLGKLSDGTFESLSSHIGPRALKELMKFWRTKRGKAKRRNLLSRLRDFDNLRVASEPIMDDNVEQTGRQESELSSMLAESGRREIGVFTVGTCRDYYNQGDEPTFIVGFQTHQVLIRNPHSFDPREMKVKAGWEEELRKFTTHEGLPFDRYGEFGATTALEVIPHHDDWSGLILTPGWLLSAYLWS